MGGRSEKRVPIGFGSHMSRWHPKTCRACGRRATEEHPISARGYCIEHGLARMVANNEQLNEHHGPWFDNWRRRLAASVGASIDDPQPEGR